MAASLLIEEESGTYSGRIRHSHNGYYAGDFSQTSHSASELRVSYAHGGQLPTRQWWCATVPTLPATSPPKSS